MKVVGCCLLFSSVTMKIRPPHNRGNYVELLYTLSEKDERLARHLATSAVFSVFSNII